MVQVNQYIRVTHSLSLRLRLLMTMNTTTATAIRTLTTTATTMMMIIDNELLDFEDPPANHTGRNTSNVGLNFLALHDVAAALIVMRIVLACRH